MAVNIAFDAFHIHIAAVPFIHTCQTLDNCRLAGAVFSHQRMDFSAPQRKRGMIKCYNARKGFDDVLHFHKNIFFHSDPLSCYPNCYPNAIVFRLIPSITRVMHTKTIAEVISVSLKSCLARVMHTKDMMACHSTQKGCCSKSDSPSRIQLVQLPDFLKSVRLTISILHLRCSDQLQ